MVVIIKIERVFLIFTHSAQTHTHTPISIHTNTYCCETKYPIWFDCDANAMSRHLFLSFSFEIDDKRIYASIALTKIRNKKERIHNNNNIIGIDMQQRQNVEREKNIHSKYSNFCSLFTFFFFSLLFILAVRLDRHTGFAMSLWRTNRTETKKILMKNDNCCIWVNK